MLSFLTYKMKLFKDICYEIFYKLNIDLEITLYVLVKMYGIIFYEIYFAEICLINIWTKIIFDIQM